MHLGPQINYDFDIEEIGIGAQFSVPMAKRLEFYPSFIWYFIGEARSGISTPISSTGSPARSRTGSTSVPA